MKHKAQKKRIGLVLSSAPGYSETFFRNKINGLQAQGHDVILFVDYAPDPNQNYPCLVVTNAQLDGAFVKRFIGLLGIFLRTLFLHFRKSAQLYQLDRADGLPLKSRARNLILNEFLLNYSLDWLHFGFGMLAYQRENVATAIGAQMAVSFRGFDLYLSPLKHPGCYDLLFKKQVCYHVLSHEMKNTLIAQKVSSEHITVITPAIDTEFFKNVIQEEQKSVLRIVTIARLHWKKGLEYTLEALAQLAQSGVVFQYSIIGAGEEQERLVFAAYQLGVLESVKFLGQLTPKAIREQLAQSDLYLQYSIQEGFCNAVLEAQAMRLLCVVSDAEGLSENVLHNKTGWVVPKRQPSLLADQIMNILKLSKAEQQKIKTTASRRVQEEFNLSKQQIEFEQFYA
ncbi:glycosyltransferase family 4 protein [Sediminibacter sp. Hel_I_10]|uniref:glycosyltransferase family 4 protein n=1 Tax=Sediminibacter sp. Hel_I_10 TaxID=1392490 RepID=UPI00047E23C3|nr:glycosyltransferase family 4 protein [Sediminibacter sp. Hel_I_10]